MSKEKKSRIGKKSRARTTSVLVLGFAVLLVTILSLFVFAALSQGPNSGTTFRNDTTVGKVAWLNSSNASSSDNNYVVSANGVTHYLNATNFSFSIPAGSTILGVNVEVEKKVSTIVPSGVIIAWPSTAASIPRGWTRVTSMDATYAKGTAAGTNPDVTGGSATHTHTSPAHQHTISSHTHSGTTGGPSATRSDGNQPNPASSTTHTHTFTSGSVSSTAQDTTATWQTASSDPSYYEVIWIQSDGTPTGIPNGSVAFYNATSAPTDWIQHVGSKGRFLKGAAASGDAGGTGGGGSHTHTADSHSHTNSDHSHPSSTSSGDSTPYATSGAEEGIVEAADDGHTHTVTLGAAPSAGTGSATSASTASTAYEPPYRTLLAVQNNNGSENLPLNITAMWLGSLADIPTGWILADGTSGTPDMRNNFTKAADATSDVGTTGGSEGHDHTDPAGHTHTASHTHALTTGANSASTLRAPGGFSFASNGHTHSGTSDATDPGTGSTVQTVDANADTQPPFRTVAYIQYRGANVTDNIVRLVVNGNVTGNNKANTTDWPASDAYTTYGSSTDTWGLSLTASDVNSAGFGVVMSADANGSQAFIDNVRITVYYNQIPTAPNITGPANYSWVSGVLNMTWNASFDADAQSLNYTVRVNGTVACTGSNATNCTSYTPGDNPNYMWNVTVTDGTDNVTSVDYWFNYDSALPKIDFVAPTDNNSGYVGRNWTYINVSVIENNTDTFIFNWNTTNVSLGGVVALYHFNNDTLDYSGSINDGFNSGANCSLTVGGRFGSACSFNSSGNSYVNVTFASSLNITSEITIAAWINPYAIVAGNSRIVEMNWQANRDDVSYSLLINASNESKFGGQFANNTDVRGLTVFQPNRWYHVAVTYNGSNARIYVNGVLENSTNQLGNMSAFGDALFIGAGHNASGRPYQFFNGTIDELRLYNRVLSSAEINASYLAEMGRYINSTIFFMNQTDLKDVVYTFYAWVNDSAGRSNMTEVRTLTIDVIPPIIGDINISDRIVRRNQSIRLNLTVTDLNNATNVSVSNVSTLYMMNTTAGLWEINTTTFALGCVNIDANCTLRFNASDAAGNSNFTLLSLIVDDVVPTIRSIAFSSNSTYLYAQLNQSNFSRVFFNSLSGEGGGQVVTVDIGYNDTNREGLDGNNTFGANTNTTNGSDTSPLRVAYTIPVGAGDNTTRVDVYDKADNFNNTNITWVQDNVDPATTDNSSSDYWNRWSNGERMVALNSVEEGSGFNRTLYCTYTPGTTPCTPSTVLGNSTGNNVTLPTCAANTACQTIIRYQSIDNVSNREAIGDSKPVYRVAGSDVNDTNATNTDIKGNSFVRTSNLTNTTIDACTVIDSKLTRSTAVKNNSYPTNCSVTSSTLIDVNLTSSVVDKSFIDPSTITNSYITNSNVTGADVFHSRVENATFGCSGLWLYESVVLNDTLTSGTIRYAGKSFFAPYSLSNICGGTAPSPVGTLTAIPSIVRDNVSVTFRYTGEGVGFNVSIDYLELRKLDINGTNLTLLDNGVVPDSVANDAVYTANYSITFNNNVADGNKTVNANVTDNVGNRWIVNATVTLDNELPFSKVLINDNNASTNSVAVALNLSFTDNVGVYQCRLANNGSSFTEWEACTSQRAWQLPFGFANKTVLFEVMDIAGNINQSNDSIELVPAGGQDDTAPTTPVVVDDGEFTNTNVALHASWSANDTESERDHFRLTFEYRINETNTSVNITAWTFVGAALEATAFGLNLTNNTNYTFEVRATNAVNLVSAVGISNGIVVDITSPTLPLINSSHNATGWSSSRLVLLNWSANDTISGVKDFSYSLTSSSVVPDDVPEVESDHELLNTGANDGNVSVLKYNSTGSASAVFVEVKGNLSAGDVVRITPSLVESTVETPDAIGLLIYVVNSSPTQFDMTATNNVSRFLNTTADVVYKKSPLNAEALTFEAVINLQVRNSFYVVISGEISDDNNNYNLLIAGSNTSAVNTTQNYVCLEGGSCVNNTNAFEYAVKVEKRDLKVDGKWDTSFLVNDGVSYFNVKARDRAGNFGDKTTMTIRVDTTPPSVPQLVEPSKYTNTTSVTFNWTQSTDVDSGVDNYYLEVDNNSDFSSKEYSQFVGNVSSQTVTVSADATYFARVLARNLAGVNSSFSGDVSTVVDTNAPVILFKKPFGTVVKSNVVLKLMTNERAICNFGSALTNFTFTNSTIHETGFTATSGSNTVTVRCYDDVLNTVTTTVSFTVSTTSTVSTVTVADKTVFTGDVVNLDVTTGLGELDPGRFVTKLGSDVIGTTITDNGGGNYNISFPAPALNGSYLVTVKADAATDTATLTVNPLLLTVTYVSSGLTGSSRETLAYFDTGEYKLGLATDSNAFGILSNSSALLVSGNSKDGSVYIFQTRVRGDVERVITLLKDQDFIDSTSPSFGYPIDDKTFILFTELRYDSLGFLPNSNYTSGRYFVSIKNTGLDAASNKTNIQVILR